MIRKTRKNTVYRGIRRKRPARGVARKLSGLTIKVLGRWHELYYGSDLPKSALKDFDWVDDPMNDQGFIKDGSGWDHVSNYMRTEGDLAEAGWQGIASDSFFSGNLIRFDRQGRYQLARYYTSDKAKTTVKHAGTVTRDKHGSLKQGKRVGFAKRRFVIPGERYKPYERDFYMSERAKGEVVKGMHGMRGEMRKAIKAKRKNPRKRVVQKRKALQRWSTARWLGAMGPSSVAGKRRVKKLGRKAGVTVGTKRKNPKRRVVRVRSHDHRDFSERMAVRKPKYAHQSGPQRYAPIRYDTTYEIITPESAEEGDVAERGYESKGNTAESVEDMVRTLLNEGATEASSSHWHRGIWYTAYGEQNYRTGDHENRSFHIRAPEAVERAIAKAMGVRNA